MRPARMYRVMKRSAVVLLVLSLALLQIGAATEKNTSTDVSVNYLLKDCILFTEAPDEVTNGTQQVFEAFHWNCGNINFNGTAWLELYDGGGNTINVATRSINHSVGEYAFLNVTWWANSTGQYGLKTNASYTGMVGNNTVTKTEQITKLFTVSAPAQNETTNETEDTQEATTTSSDDDGVFTDVRELSVDLSSSKQIWNIVADNTVLLRPTVTNTGDITAANLSITLDAPAGWRTSTAYISRLAPNRSVQRELLLQPAPDTDPGVYLVKGRLRINGNVWDTETFLIDVASSDETTDGAPELKITRFSPEITLFHDESGAINYTLENAGDDTTTDIEAYLQNEEQCLKQVARKHAPLAPQETVSAALQVSAKQVVATCNTTLIAKTPRTADAVTVQVAVRAKEHAPVSLPDRVRQQFDELELPPFTGAIMLILLAILAIFLELRFREEDLPSILGLLALRQAETTETEQEVHRCEECDKTFDSKHGLKVHNGMKHNTEKRVEEITERMRRAHKKLQRIDVDTDDDA